MSPASLDGTIAPAAPLPAVFADGRFNPRSLPKKRVAKNFLRTGALISNAWDAISNEARFRAGYQAISSERSRIRVREREERERREAETPWVVREARIEAASAREFHRAADISRKISASVGKPKGEKLFTPAESRWYARYLERGERRRALQEALPSDLIARYAQPSRCRIYEKGYAWGGGLVAGRYWQDTFVAHGLNSWEQPLLKRFLAATPKAATGELKAGRSKDSCRVIRRKIVAFDEPYVFFGNRCRDLWRIDIDRRFRSAAHLQAWIDDLHASGRLPFKPHVACWIFDDRQGGIINPHLWFVLPERKAVWHDAKQHDMLKRVIASLTHALGGDPGGLGNPFHGKNPVSVHCRNMIINDTSFPTLSDYAAAMTLTNSAARMARRISTEKLIEVDFDSKDSNTWFNAASRVCNETATQLCRLGMDCTDRVALEESVFNAAWEALAPDVTNMSKKKIAAIEALIASCAKWTAGRFDERLPVASGAMEGAAAHLIEEDDDLTTRRAKGGAYAASVEGSKYEAKVSAAIRAVLRDGGPEPTFRQIADATGFAVNTVKKHWFSAYTQAVAALSIQRPVKGVSTSSDDLPSLVRPSRPSPVTLRTAHSIDVIPHAWRNPNLIDHFRVKLLNFSRSKRGSGRPIMPKVHRIATGGNLIDFLSAGGVRVHHTRVRSTEESLSSTCGDASVNPDQT